MAISVKQNSLQIGGQAMSGAAKNLHVTVLLDFYGEMLTQKQREVVELYYNEDLSLAEIAEHSGITRQGVRDSIKRAENQLLDCESKLGLWARFLEIRRGLEEIADVARQLQSANNGVGMPRGFKEKTQRIIDLAERLNT
jgi:predicted DNA-binding protein YlxM (UPF0122 family)